MSGCQCSLDGEFCLWWQHSRRYLCLVVHLKSRFGHNNDPGRVSFVIYSETGMA